MKRGKSLGLQGVLAEIKAGLNPAKISKKYKTPKQSIAYYVGKLEKLGCIRNAGYATWEFVKEVPIDTIGSGEPQIGTSKGKEIRGHAFIWKIGFIDPPNWEKIKYTKVKYQKIHKKKTYRIMFQNRKIWLTQRGMIIYEPLDFMGPSAFTVKGTAVFEMDRLIKDLFEKLGLTFMPYTFTCSREHYAIVKHHMAKQFNDAKMKIKVEHEGINFWIDHSHGVNEEETDDPVMSKRAHDFYKDQMKTGFQVKPTMVMESITKLAEENKKNAEHLGFHAENMRSHVGAVKDLRTGVNLMTDKINELIQVIEKLKR